MAQAKRIFVSHSTDMSSYPLNSSFATVACSTIRQLGHSPVEMSQFLARDVSPAEYCRELVQKSDFLIAIIGFKYGSVVPDQEPLMSFTEYEYSEAQSHGIPTLVFMLDERVPVPRHLVDVDGRRIENFRQQILDSNVTVVKFKSVEDLVEVLRDSLNALINNKDHELPLRTASSPDAVPWMAPILGTTVARPGVSDSLLKHLLDPDFTSVGITTALEGAGGFGKTTLAASVCSDSRLQERYPGGLVWLTLGEDVHGDSLADLVNSATEILSGERSTTSDPMVAGAQLGKTINERPDTLMVLDDVWTHEQLAPFMLGGWRVRRLVTTRIRNVLPRGSISITVDAMLQNEAEQLLGMNLPSLPRPLVTRLLELTGRWPVLLSLINACIADNVAVGASVESAAQWVIDRLAVEGPTALDIRHPSSRAEAVGATMEASLERLSLEDLDRYQRLAVFPEDSIIPQSALRLAWGTTAPADAQVVDSTLQRICQLRLGTRRWFNNEPALSLHDIVRAFLRSKLGADQLRRINSDFVDMARSHIATSSDPAAATAWWKLPRSEEYLWRNLCWHISEMEDPSELEHLVCDLRWMTAKAKRFQSVSAAISDLDHASGGLSKSLRSAIRDNHHLLPLLSPAHSLDSNVITRLQENYELREVVRSFSETINTPRVAALWPMPDAPHDTASRTTPTAHQGRVWSCAFCPESRLMVTAADDMVARIWDVRTGAMLRELVGHGDAVRHCAISADGTRIVTASADRTARIWDTHTGDLITTLQGHSGGVNGCAISPDGQLVATASTDRRVRIWNAEAGELLRELVGHRDAVRHCAISADGTRIVTASADCTARIWDTHTGDLITTLQGHLDAVRHCAISADGTRIVTASADRTARIWDTHTGDLITTLQGHSGGVNGCAISPDGELVATAGADRTARLWDIGKGDLMTVLRGHSGGVNGCAISVDGQLVATASGDRTVRIWNARTGDAKRVLPGESSGANACVVSNNGRLLVTANGNRRADVWTLNPRHLRVTLAGHADWVNGCSISHGASLVATASTDKTVRVWDAETGRQLVVHEGHDDWVRACAFMPAQPGLLLSVSDDTTARLWHTSSRMPERLYTGHTDWVLGCAFSPNGKMFATAGADRKVCLWNIDQTTPAKVLTGHSEWVRGCAFSPDGSWLATSSGDRTIRVWSADTGAVQMVLEGHTDWVNSCDISPDGELIASVGSDRVMKIWDAASGVCLTSFMTGGRLSDCKWVSIDSIALVGDAGVYFLRFTPGLET